MAGENFLDDDLDPNKDGEIDDPDLDPDEDDELDPDESIDALRQSIEDSYDDTPSQKKVDTDDNKQTLEIADETFFSGSADDLEELTKDPAAFNKLLNSVYRKGVESSNTRITENFLRSAPEIVKRQVVEHLAIQKSVTQFYTDNKDLIPYKKTVAAIVNKVASENPDFSLKEVLKETEKISRAKLKLTKKASDNDGKTGNKFPKKPGGGDRRVVKKGNQTTGMEKEIDDMLGALGK